MPARVGSDLFWAGRYLERAEATARLLDVTFHGLLEERPEQAQRMLRDLLDALVLGGEYQAVARPYLADAVTEFLVLDRSNPGSIRSAVGIARENIRNIQEKVSRELWEALNSFHLDLAGPGFAHEVERQPFEVFTRVRRGCQTVVGIIDETMSHNDGWRFLTMGRQLERALLTTRLLDVYFRQLLSRDQGIAFHHWVSVLRSAGAFQEYRKVFQASLDPADAIEFLVQSEDFPRSVLRATRVCERMFRLVRSDETDSPARRLIGTVRSSLEFADLPAVLAEGSLEDLLGDTLAGLERFAESVVSELFALE
ncbi:MAG: alpha-E domain-containing protein [Acidimicrobiia bacterium]|nr:alpha-E domain-containing protein [Acidimicrobiia bacterium]